MAKRNTSAKRARSAASPRTRGSAARLGQNNYGKSRVRMVKVSRAGKVHTVRDLTVDIAIEGNFGAVHTRADNALCLPTDTMKNTVYALGKDHPIETIESFALHVSEHFVSRNRHVRSARVRISQAPWERLRVRGREHPHAFTRAAEERQTCEVAFDRGGAHVSGGIEGLVILKSTESAFSGFQQDEYTTLAATRDRIFATSMTAAWTFAGPRPQRAAFGACRERIRRALVETFATHRSESVQHTLYAMGEAALRACKPIDSIRISMPNKHCLLVNLLPFGLENENEVFVPTDEPYGLIEATIERR